LEPASDALVLLLLASILGVDMRTFLYCGLTCVLTFALTAFAMNDARTKAEARAAKAEQGSAIAERRIATESQVYRHMLYAAGLNACPPPDQLRAEWTAQRQLEASHRENSGHYIPCSLWALPEGSN
jgi:hypothetical protein